MDQVTRRSLAPKALFKNNLSVLSKGSNGDCSMTDEAGPTSGKIPGCKRPGCAEFIRTFVNRATLSDLRDF